MSKEICVIGGGLAGGVAAAQLAAEGHSVTLIERGGDNPEPFMPSDEVWRGAEPKAAFTRGAGIGGTSNYWHGGLIVLDKSDVEGIPENSPYPKIPIPYSAFQKYYNQAVSLICKERNYSLMDVQSQPDDSNFSINNDIFKFKALLYPSSPFSTKPLITHAEKQYGLRVIKNFEAKRVLFQEKKRVTGIEGFEVESGKTKAFYADIFIVSAGGIGSPKILLESAKFNPQLQRLPIGKFLIDHPSGFVFKAKLRHRMNLRPLFGQSADGYRTQHGFALKADQLQASFFRNHILFLRPALSMKDPLVYDFLKRKLVAYKGRRLSLTDIAYLFRHTDLLFDAVNFKYGVLHSTNYVSGLIFAEQLPGEQHSITCNNEQFLLQWDITEEDSQSIEKFIKVFFDAHPDIFESFTIFPNMPKRLDTAGHHSGGCRMAASPANGVVDSDLRVFGTDNLFVADGSVLGFSGHANTGLTIVALALKCCDTVSRL